MCQEFIGLAQLDDTRFVGQCEHGTVSLTWQHCTWHLQPADFLGLAALLPSGEGHSRCFVLDCYDGKRVLWCGDACLVLRGERFDEFCSLVALAAPLVVHDRGERTGRGARLSLN